MYVEFIKYKLKDGVDLGQVEDVIVKAHRDFISKQKGFICWESLTLIDNAKIGADLLHWETLEDAKAASEKFMTNESCQALMALSDMESVEMMKFEVLRKLE
jgi:hypothetical protein